MQAFALYAPACLDERKVLIAPIQRLLHVGHGYPFVCIQGKFYRMCVTLLLDVICDGHRSYG